MKGMRGIPIKIRGMSTRRARIAVTIGFIGLIVLLVIAHLLFAR
jgi:hypothetical protein